MRVLILRCGDAPLPADLPGTVLDLPAVPGRRDLKLLDAAAFTCARAERIVLNRLEAGCTAPVASHSTIDADGTIHLTAGVYALDGSAQLVYTGSGTDPVAVGEAAAADLLGRGAADLIAKERPGV